MHAFHVPPWFWVFVSAGYLLAAFGLVWAIAAHRRKGGRAEVVLALLLAAFGGAVALAFSLLIGVLS